MKDRIFEGRDVPRALEAASLGLGLPLSRLRYVVLDEGRAETPAAPPRPARIAVLLDALSASVPSASPAHVPPPPGPRGEPPRDDAKTRIGRLVSAVAEAAGEPLSVSFEESDETLVARLHGPAEGLLLAAGGEGLRALEHIAQRAAAAAEPRRLLLTSARFREERDGYLRERARQLAAEVRQDGAPRQTEPLNSYDRRIVHLAVQDEAGVRSFSVGEGPARCVTVAPPAGSPGPDPQDR